ncbi:alpha-(1-_6)-mannopyranosyltransferase A [Corynebacterium breve]|uniref:Alpha-(1->6)-mannopyranosyltransferase A n=1 Tax=Corynebacterium breve TaxID=3049799 RepID=A0ABY8VE13_9CORY|nr:alpha-(1->6)-mannopyranosyltransferase A [Corynebacterium breve]WIM66985.1 alpha-(1->6)-mannopyranosyltransferase A [Corynebacterium breve]
MLDRLARLSPTWLGLTGTILLALGSFGAGATRNRGGVISALGLEFLTFGHGKGIMEIVLFVGIALLIGAWVLLGRTVVVDKPAGSSERFTTTKRAMWIWIAPLAAAAPVLSRDVYSYLMQGAMVRDGFDPYTEGAAVNPGPYLLEVSHDWRNTTTPYGPLHLWIGEGVTTLVGDNVIAGLIVYKIISIAGFAAIAWAVPRIAQKLGGDPTMALWLGVANPVMVLHMIGGMHNESIMVGLVSVGLLAALNRHFVSSVVLISVAVSLKATAAIALPFVVWIATNHYAPKSATFARRIFAFVASGFIGVVLTFLVVGIVTWASGSSWGWLAEISGNSKVVNPLSAPTFIADRVTPFLQLFDERFPYNTVLGVTRTVGSILMLTGLVIVWWFFRHNDRRAIMGTTLAYQVAYTFNAVALPWYYASVITLIGTFRPPLWLLQLTTGTSIVLAMAFTGSGNHRFYDMWWLGAALIVAWIATHYVFPLDAKTRPGLQLVTNNAAKMPSPARGE